MNAVVYWFSGTGGSWLMASRIAASLEAGGIPSRLVALEGQPRPKFRLAASRAWFSSGYDDGNGVFNSDDPDGIDIFCFPIYAFTEPALVDRFATRLPVSLGRAREGKAAAHGRKAAVVATMGGGGYEGRALRRMKRLLEESGRSVVLTAAVEMPEAFVQFQPASAPEVAEARVQAGLAAADAIAVDIVAGRSSLRKAKPAGIAATWLVSVLFRSVARRLLGFTWSASEACTGCGLCASSCPARTIAMHGKRPHWGARCEACQRCANLCPVGAIRLSVPRLVLLLAPLVLPWGKWLDSLLGPEAGGPGFLLWLAGCLAGTAAVCLLMWLADFVPGLRRLLSASSGGISRKWLAPGFAAELGRIRKPR